MDEQFPVYALVTNHMGAEGVEKSPLWLVTTYRGIRLAYYVDGDDVPRVVNVSAPMFFEAAKVPLSGAAIRPAPAKEARASKVTVGPGTPVTVIAETKASVKARVEHPGVILEGYFQPGVVGTTFIMGSQDLAKPRVNAKLVERTAAAGAASVNGQKPAPPRVGTPVSAERRALSVPVLDAPNGRSIATLTSNEHTFVEADREATKDGFRWVVVHTTPVSLLPVVEGPVVSGWIRESQLDEVKARTLEEWPVKEQPMPDAGAHGPDQGKKRNLEPRTILLAEPDGQVVGAVVSDGVSATPRGDSDVVLVNNGFGSTFSLYLGGILIEEKRRSRHAPGQAQGMRMGRAPAQDSMRKQ